MDEARWLNGTDPLALLDSLHPPHTLESDQPQTRAQRMYLLACARRKWHRLTGVCRGFVELAEIFADAPRQREPLRARLAMIAEQLMLYDAKPDHFVNWEVAALMAEYLSVAPEVALADVNNPAPLPPRTADERRGLATLVYLPFEQRMPVFSWVPRQLHSLRLLREVFGNPYRRIEFSPAWRTDTAMTLARQIYESREFSAMPILADALQDAGCDNDAILSHLRDRKQTHVRGCWVLDQLLKFR